MSLAYLFDSNIQFQDRSGNNNVNGFLRVYIDNTDDRAVTYKDFNGTLNQADIRLDNNGRAVVIVDDSKTYRLEVYGTTGVLLWTLYPISPKATGINETLEALVAAVKSHTIAIEGLALGKKNKQQAKVISGTPTKTVKSFSQNADGEIFVEFEYIAFPHKVLVDGEDSVPKHLEDAVMADELGRLRVYVGEREDSTPENPDKVLVIDDHLLREDIDTNSQRIENLEEIIAGLDVDSVPRAYLHSTLNQSAGDNVTTSTTINVFAQDALEGDCFEFEQTTTIDDTPFGYVWIEPGTYLINASVTLQWVGDPRGTFIAKVGSVMGENFDFSQEQELKRQSTKVVTIPSRMKLAVNVTYDAGTPVMGFWIQSMQVVKLAGGMSQTTVAHGLSLKGNGSVEDPLAISEHGLQEAFDYSKDKSYFATKQEVAPLATQAALQAETARATQRENEIEALFVLPTQEAVDAWLDAHPEATTTVQDRSLTEQKFTDELALKTIKDYMTPEMFGAVGDGVTDDTVAIKNALTHLQTSNGTLLLKSVYAISDTLVVPRGVSIVGTSSLLSAIKCLSDITALTMVQTQNLSFSVLENFRIIGFGRDDDFTGTGLLLNSANACVIRNVHISWFRTGCILDSSINNNLVEVYITMCYDGLVGKNGSYNNRFSLGTITGMTHDGISGTSSFSVKVFSTDIEACAHGAITGTLDFTGYALHIEGLGTSFGVVLDAGGTINLQDCFFTNFLSAFKCESESNVNGQLNIYNIVLVACTSDFDAPHFYGYKIQFVRCLTSQGASRSLISNLNQNGGLLIRSSYNSGQQYDFNLITGGLSVNSLKAKTAYENGLRVIKQVTSKSGGIAFGPIAAKGVVSVDLTIPNGADDLNTSSDIVAVNENGTTSQTLVFKARIKDTRTIEVTAVNITDSTVTANNKNLIVGVYRT